MVRVTWLVMATLIVPAAVSPVRAQESDEVKRLKEKIGLLESKLELAKRDNDDLKKRIAELEKGGAKKADEAGKADPLAVGTRWKDKAIFSNGPIRKAEVTVTERTDKGVALSVNYEGGAVWVFKCDVNGTQLKITDIKVKKGLDSNNGRKAVVGAATGKGSVKDGVLKLSYIVPGSAQEPGFRVELTAKLEK